MQLLIREKIEDMLNPDCPRNHLLKYLPPFLPNLLFVKSMKNLEHTHTKYKQLPKGPSLIPNHLIVSMKKKAEREKARPPKFGSSIAKKKEDENNYIPSSTDGKTDAPPEEVKTIEVDPEEIQKRETEGDVTTKNSTVDQAPPPKPTKPKVHIYSHGLPFFYAHKWVYEDISSSHSSAMNTGIKKDQSN